MGDFRFKYAMPKPNYYMVNKFNKIGLTKKKHERIIDMKGKKL